MSTENPNLWDRIPLGTKWRIVGLGGTAALTALYIAGGMYIYDSADKAVRPDAHITPEEALFDFFYFFAIVGSVAAAWIVLKKAGELDMGERLEKNCPNF